MTQFTEIFLVFLRIGGLTFGGGMAMLPLLQKEVVEHYHWATEDELMDYYAIGQCTPGIIAVNTATFIGYKQKGILGGIVATLGVILIPMVIITLIAAFLQNFAEITLIQDAFAGIQVCVCVLIFHAVKKLVQKSVLDKPTTLIFLLVLLLSLHTNLSPILLVLGAALVSMILPYSTCKKQEEKK